MNKVKKEHPEANLCAVSAERFTIDIIDAIRLGKTRAFREQYRVVDMLFVDDIQFIGGKDFAMEELFNTFNELYMANNRLVFTSDRPPRELPALDDRLRSRFESGLVVDIQPPDFETRVAIIQNKALTLGFNLSDDISHYIAANITNNIRQLEGAVKKIMAYHHLMAHPLSMDTAQQAIRDLSSENPGLNPSTDHIINEVCKFFNLDIEEILSTSKRANIVHARQMAIYLIKSLMDISYTQIGAVFKRDHTTIMHSINQIEAKKVNDNTTAKEIATVIRNIRG
jgi:chromosomal replication initiator protein